MNRDSFLKLIKGKGGRGTIVHKDKKSYDRARDKKNIEKNIQKEEK